MAGLQDHLVAKAPPIQIDQHGVARIGTTRVTLETVMHHYGNGASPEEIALRFSSLRLSDIYTVIAFCLEHEAEVKAYTEEAQEESDRVLEQVLRNTDHAKIRERLLSRQERAA